MPLFWKVFATLLLTLLSTFTAASWLSQAWLEDNQKVESRMQFISSFAETALQLYQQNQPAHFRHWLHDTIKTHHFRAALVDSLGNNILPHHLTPELSRLAKQAAQQQKAIQHIHPPYLLTATPLSINHTHYYWLASSPLAPNQMRQSQRTTLWIRLATMLLALILISWFLTRMFTRPIQQLQTRTEQLGQGKLATRVSKPLAKRQDEIGQLSRSFNHMASQLEALIHSHKQLLRDISHELRSPLARLQVALELARNEASDTVNAELNRIDKEAAQLNALIGEVLTLARFEQGAVQYQEDLIALDKLLSNIASDAAFEAESMGKAVHCQIQKDCQIKGDQRWVTRALENIIRNAIRHTKPNRSVDISLHVKDSFAVVHIRDHGDGVEDTLLPHLFKPFFRATDARERHQDTSGYGLGLAIAQQAIALQGGNIQASNHPDGGLNVCIRLKAF